MNDSRREKALVPLALDHRRALEEARRLRHAAGGEGDEGPAALDAFIAFFQDDAVACFRKQESIVLPLVINEPNAIVAAMRLMGKHIRMESVVRKIQTRLRSRAPSDEVLNSLAEMLEANVCFEKEQLSLIERCLDGKSVMSVFCARCKHDHTDRDVNGELFSICIPCQAELVEDALRLHNGQ
jgi:hypothetical protein